MASHIHSVSTPIYPPSLSLSPPFAEQKQALLRIITGKWRNQVKETHPRVGRVPKGGKKVPTHFCVESLKGGNVSQAVPVKNRNLSQSCREAVSKKKKRNSCLKNQCQVRVEALVQEGAPLHPCAPAASSGTAAGVWGQL